MSHAPSSDATLAGAQVGGKAGHILCLDGVRAASILFVLAAHTVPLGPKGSEMNLAAGRVGMALFFCLSGYLITSMLYRKPQVGPFLAKRVMRIVPALALYLGVLLVFFDLPLKSFLLTLGFVSNYAVEGLSGGAVEHLWSLCVEMHFYVVISLLVLALGRRAVWLVFPAALVVTGLRIEGEVAANINTHLRVDEILVGGWLALISLHHGARLRGWLTAPGLAAGVIAVLFGLFLASSHNASGPLVYIRPYLAMALIGAIMHCNLRPLLMVLESRPAQHIARISYALYIWHMLMVSGWMNEGSTLERYGVKRPISWALSWGAAYISTTYWESYWQTRVRQWLARGSAPA